jgi:hypothetical protein
VGGWSHRKTADAVMARGRLLAPCGDGRGGHALRRDPSAVGGSIHIPNPFVAETVRISEGRRGSGRFASRQAERSSSGRACHGRWYALPRLSLLEEKHQTCAAMDGCPVDLHPSEYRSSARPISLRIRYQRPGAIAHDVVGYCETVRRPNSGIVRCGYAGGSTMPVPQADRVRR